MVSPGARRDDDLLGFAVASNFSFDRVGKAYFPLIISSGSKSSISSVSK